MGIFDALNTSVGGLQAQSFALQNISGNIANAQTTGYKGISTAFSDLIPDSTNPDRQVAGGVTSYAVSTITTQGTVSASTVGTYMAITGDGFFNVQSPTGTVDNQPVFSGVTYYTRRGDTLYGRGTNSARTRLTCLGPLKYVGDHAIQLEIDTLRSALEGRQCEEAFLPAAGPAIKHQAFPLPFPSRQSRRLRRETSRKFATWR